MRGGAGWLVARAGRSPESPQSHAITHRAGAVPVAVAVAFVIALASSHSAAADSDLSPRACGLLASLSGDEVKCC